MTRHVSTPTPQPTPPEDPYANKALVAAIVTIITVLSQLAATDWNFSLNQEGITAIGGAVTTILVFLVSNWKRRGA